jgi:hypothetical protein
MKTIYTLCRLNAGITHGNYGISNPHVAPRYSKRPLYPVGRSWEGGGGGGGVNDTAALGGKRNTLNKKM